MSILQKIQRLAGAGAAFSTFQTLHEELREALSAYWDIAADVLHGSGISVPPAPPDYFSLEKNFFSGLFLYSYYRAGIPASRRILYAGVNQCLRGMVTGCDNILDNEYKKTLETDLPQEAIRFRSILDIMVSDRVLMALLLRECREGRLKEDQIEPACFESLRALTRSGAQEASEEGGTGDILPPESILSTVHHDKTGILFQSPWALPNLLEPDLPDVGTIKQALFRIGMGCQILDDMVDLDLDLLMDRHNYAVSLIHHGESRSEKERLSALLARTGEREPSPDLLHQFPEARKTAAASALSYLKKGTTTLFEERHRFMSDLSISFIAERIGAESFLADLISPVSPVSPISLVGRNIPD